MKQENLKLGLLGALLSLVLVGCTTPDDKTGGAGDQQTVEDDATSTRVGVDDGSDVGVTDGGSDPLAGVDTIFYFDFDKAVLKPEAREALLIHAEALRNNPRNIRLEGHADERGTREYNLALAERRANTVRDFLLLQGVNGSNVEVISYGEEKPAVFGTDADSMALNRRVELK
ncbi:OmpA family protein [Porticoccus sp. W117]|uniref:OmpA family protein n=1 Tax=Porticoccus sp. W117 TaxID=3054777 RepID=UPI002592D2F1|nr:OmpA family protein [Porticoccus sp. W117]MDM3871241.1 OmpA family protein [Porticoccus sp. W117]